MGTSRDLVPRDMGYFSLGEFTAIEACGAWWLTRLPLTTGVRLENGRPLEKLLEIRRHSIHDLGVIVGEQGKKCRIGAVVGRARLRCEKLYDLLAGQLIKAPGMAAVFDFVCIRDAGGLA